MVSDSKHVNRLECPKEFFCNCQIFYIFMPNKSSLWIKPNSKPLEASNISIPLLFVNTLKTSRMIFIAYTLINTETTGNTKFDACTLNDIVGSAHMNNCQHIHWHSNNSKSEALIACTIPDSSTQAQMKSTAYKIENKHTHNIKKKKLWAACGPTTLQFLSLLLCNYD